ncbi:hypothetical protein OH491_12650 [Termitidicoccus mucosus]|uniref:hypothetical protein n=1 Tax=Termitidicoccus mucosus TaxID=1184151 RepID=UPI002FEE3E39
MRQRHQQPHKATDTHKQQQRHPSPPFSFADDGGDYIQRVTDAGINNHLGKIREELHSEQQRQCADQPALAPDFPRRIPAIGGKSRVETRQHTENPRHPDTGGAVEGKLKLRHQPGAEHERDAGNERRGRRNVDLAAEKPHAQPADEKVKQPEQIHCQRRLKK